MGSNRKLIGGAVLVVAALVFWGLMTALNNLGGDKSGGNRVATAPNAVTVKVSAPSGRMIAYAASDIPQGTLVTKNMLEMRELAGNGPTSPFITDLQNQGLNFVTSTRIPKGALIRPSDDFVGHISEVGVAGMLRPGTRAIVIPFANKPTLHDLVAIGNYIDINAAFDGQEARTIVPNVRVLAVDVFGSDFPQVNIARRGTYRAEPRAGSAPAPGEASAVPGATPTPTPAPAQAPGRPDPAVTLEVTPEQANRILLAQASGGVLDFVVLPARGDAVLVNEAQPGTLVGDQLGALGGLTTISAVTKPQLAPYAERKKAAGGGSNSGNSTRSASASGGNRASGGGSPRIRRLNNFPPPLPLPNPGSAGMGGTGMGTSPLPIPPAGENPAPAESPTYNIPIYADGRTVRVETVQRPQN